MTDLAPLDMHVHLVGNGKSGSGCRVKLGATWWPAMNLPSRPPHRRRPVRGWATGVRGSGLRQRSNRGAQYASIHYGAVLEQNGITPSMNRRANCYDNAHMESFWGTLKAELVTRHLFATRREAWLAIIDHVQTFYNRVQLHSALGLKSSMDYEINLNLKRAFQTLGVHQTETAALRMRFRPASHLFSLLLGRFLQHFPPLFLRSIKARMPVFQEQLEYAPHSIDLPFPAIKRWT